jgi:hypothetical protein
MKRNLLARRPSPAMVVAIVALVSSLTGGAVAATLIDGRDIKNGSITKKDLHKNSVNTKKVKNETLKAVDFAPGQLKAGVQGIQGLKGDKGEPGQDGTDGAPGTPATKLWAIVAVDNVANLASLSRNSGAVSAVRTSDGEGTFQVVFNQDISACSWQVSLGKPDTAPLVSGEISAGLRSMNSSAIYVRTWGSNGTAADRGFHAAVFC